MTKYYPELDHVSEVLECIPHPKTDAIAKAIRTCNDDEVETIKKVCSILKVIL
ncbi:hypothetical protein [Acinetobacter rathckeae]|uniref:hypothetical protein n=1 Tax=Acinetobacter rathckeae TaxID=2605272 RepID=UPI0018A2E1C0|nr:hypothetical protein [Acinetobacter rathckeae]MBF7687701.1 hypothetical protein [Acinetobacter rathckeae]